MKTTSQIDIESCSSMTINAMKSFPLLSIILLVLHTLLLQPLHSQWTTTANVVQLNSNNLLRPVSVTDVTSNINQGKFHVQGDPSDHFNDWLVYLHADRYASSGNVGAILTIQGDRFSNSDPVLIQGLRQSVTDSASFQISYLGNARFLGELDLNYDGRVGSAIKVMGDQALWYNDDHFSWGFDANWNRIAKPVTIGSGVRPGTNVGLRVDGGRDINVVGGNINMMGTDNSILFSEASIASTPGQMTIQHNQTNGNIRMITKEGEFQFINNRTGLYINGENVGIGVSDPEHNLQVVGDVGITGEFIVLSDRRVKERIKDIVDASTTLNQLRPVAYNYSTEKYPALNLSERSQFGLIAQEVKEVIPNIITEHTSIDLGEQQEEVLQGVNYNAIIPLLIKGHQELANRISDLERVVEDQQKLIDLLKDGAEE